MCGPGRGVRRPTAWVERFFGTLKYEHLCRAIIADGDALAVEVALFRQTYNTLRPHQALADRTHATPTSPTPLATNSDAQRRSSADVRICG